MRRSIFLFFCILTIHSAWSSTVSSYEQPYLSPLFVAADKSLWVAPEGDDVVSGRESVPLRTFAEMVSRVSEYLRAVVIDSELDLNNEMVSRVSEYLRAFPEERITIFFHKGVYPLQKAAAIKGWKGSARKPIRWGTLEGGGTVHDGGKVVSGWEKVADSLLGKDAFVEWKKRLDPEALEQGWMARLDNPGISSWDEPATLGKQLEFCGNGKPQILARWPNDGFGRSVPAIGPTKKKTWIAEGLLEGFFPDVEKKPSRWLDVPDVRLCGYGFWDWAEEYTQVEKGEPQEKKIALKKPFHHDGDKDGFRYYAMSLLCELDAPDRRIFSRYGKQDSSLASVRRRIALGNAGCTLGAGRVAHAFAPGFRAYVSEGFHFRYGRETACGF